jgi:hypothetical protein
MIEDSLRVVNLIQVSIFRLPIVALHRPCGFSRILDDVPEFGVSLRVVRVAL